MIKLAEELVAYAKKKGATDAQVTIYDETEFSVEIREQNIEKLTEAGSKSLGLKVILDNKVAVASTSDMSKDTIHKLIDNAIERAKFSGTDEFAVLPEKELVTVDVDSLKLYDESVKKMKPEDKIAFAKKIEAIGLADKRIRISDGSSYGSSYGEMTLANSKGFSGSYKFSSTWTGVEFQCGEGDNLLEDGWFEVSRNPILISQAEEIAQKAIFRATRLIGAKKVKTQKVPIVFDPEMTSAILGFLEGCINGHALYMKQSFLVGKLGQKIASENVNIIDDGLIPGGHGTRPFDREGVSTRKNTIIENGVLKNYILDTYSAKKLNLKSTGHAGGTTNFYLAAGKYSPEEIIKSVDNGFYIVKAMGQGTNATTGDISRGAYGMWIENGKLSYPVAEITISGNLGDMLQNIEMVGNDLKFDRSTVGPTMKVNGMTISGL